MGSGGEVTPGRLGNLTAGIENIEQPEMSMGSNAMMRQNVSFFNVGFFRFSEPTALATGDLSIDILVPLPNVAGSVFVRVVRFLANESLFTAVVELATGMDGTLRTMDVGGYRLSRSGCLGKL